ncbi:MAG: maleylpyruvate isomerase family mycothiol-dependent enzyme [Propionibacteriaceae bacterium]|nr:maleylpyruvate isomerase family mycothiol-dependent enzyme [Propionibacteriaceae bacterium]
MNDDEVWAAVDRRRLAIIDLLEGLSPEKWEVQSLCEAWTVHQVAAHLTMPLLGMGGLLGLAVRYPGSTNRLIRDGSIHLARTHDTAEILDRLRRLVGYHKPFPGLTCLEALIDAVGHTLDLTIPLDRYAPLPADEAAVAADRVLSYRGRGNAKVFRRTPIAGYRLSATDHPWSTGSGPEITATMTDLFLLLTGRTARIDALTGPGADRLRQEVTATPTA